MGKSPICRPHMPDHFSLNISLSRAVTCDHICLQVIRHSLFLPIDQLLASFLMRSSAFFTAGILIMTAVSIISAPIYMMLYTIE